jgi:signal transduction histidine kinase/FixJ family two-component response regulator
MIDVRAHGTGFQILWVDEDLSLLQRVRGLLAGLLPVQVTSNAETALELASSHPPALICVAAALRTQAGLPLVRALRALPNLGDSTILVSCPRGQEAAYSDEFFELVDDLLLIPFSSRELRLRLKAHVQLWRARQESRARDAFLSSLGHELRTPITAIQLWAGSLRSGALNEGELQHAVDAITSSAHSQSRRIDDLLDLSRLTVGTLVLNRSSVALSPLLENTRNELAPLATAKHIALQLELPQPLGNAEVDARRIRQVLSNLLSNAIKFTPAGGTVSVRAKRSGESIEIEVSDTGEGISPEAMHRLFERLSRGSAGESQRQTGLGIGLALSRQLIELHGGSLEGSSAGPGRGASFRVRLPCAHAQHASPTDVRPDTQKRQRALRGRTVLLVEDHQETRDAMQIILEHAGCHVLAAEDGSRALALLGIEGERLLDSRRESVDVIVCDLTLPGISGYELISRAVQVYQLRQLSPPPSCALSAHAREADRQRALSAGFDLHLTKPITADALVEVVDDLCQVAAAQAHPQPPTYLNPPTVP